MTIAELERPVALELAEQRFAEQEGPQTIYDPSAELEAWQKRHITDHFEAHELLGLLYNSIQQVRDDTYERLDGIPTPETSAQRRESVHGILHDMRPHMEILVPMVQEISAAYGGLKVITARNGQLEKFAIPFCNYDVDTNKLIAKDQTSEEWIHFWPWQVVDHLS